MTATCMHHATTQTSPHELITCLFHPAYFVPPISGCLSSSMEPSKDFDELMSRGHTGDTSVLPAIMRLLATGGEDCSQRLFACDDPESPISKAQWKAFFDASSASRFLRLQPFPADGDPWALWSACCTFAGAGRVAEHVLRLARSCPSGAAALLMAVLPRLQEGLWEAAALEGFQTATQIANQLDPLGDCRWIYQTNRASWSQIEWFLSDPVGGSLPCGPAAPRIYVDEPEEFKALWANPLLCAERGLCFTEVWLHEFLRRAECRVDDPQEADFIYAPIYMSCYNLIAAVERNQKAPVALEGFMSRLLSQSGPPLLLVFSCEKWKLPQKWLQRLSQRGYVAAAVEAKPLLHTKDFGATTSTAPTGTWHCQDCFRLGYDIVIPSAVAATESHRLKSFNRKPEDRSLLLTWRGEHAESASKDVREGYLEVNETVRSKIIKAYQYKRGADVGSSSIRYSFLMGNSHFCLVPRGRGWWTVRLFEAIHAGCIPVLLSDEVELPFQDIVSWETFSVKWPMDDVGDKLYNYLDALRNDWPKLKVLHDNVRAVSCWFDYLQPSHPTCSPYQGLLKQLSALVSGDRPPPRGRLLKNFWF